MIDRGAITVRWKQPILDWARSVPGEVTEDALTSPEPVVYLVPIFEDEDEQAEFMALAWSAIFENELDSWHTEEADWPKGRTQAMFATWFDVEPISVVLDLVDAPLQDHA